MSSLSASATINQAQEQPARWGAVFAMSLCAFALIASEFMPVSLLTPVAADLGVSQGQAGQAIAISGIFAVLTSLFVIKLAGGIDRKVFLLLMTVLMVISGIIVSLAPNYIVFMVGRALIGVVVGGFWSMSVAVAMQLVPVRHIPRAMAIFNGGNALATIIAAPLGSFLGQYIGWRGAFFTIVPVALFVLCWQWLSLPAMKPQKRKRQDIWHVLRLLKHSFVVLGMMAIGLLFAGQFALFTYVRPFLETFDLMDVSTLSLILLLVGVSGFIGTSFISVFLKNALLKTLIVMPTLMSMLALALVLGSSYLGVVIVLLACWGLIATAAPVGWWTWLARFLPKEAEAGGGLMVAVIQLAITSGAAMGGLLFDAKGYQASFILSGFLLILGGFFAYLAAKSLHAHA